EVDRAAFCHGGEFLSIDFCLGYAERAVKMRLGLLGDAPRQRIEISRRDLTESEFAKAIKPAPCFAGAHENLAAPTICICSSALLQELLPKRDVDGVFRRETKIQRAL